MNDILHREEGPAIIFPDGTEEWYCWGSLHRIDGYAATYPDGKKECYIYGKQVSASINTDKKSKLLMNESNCPSVTHYFP